MAGAGKQRLDILLVERSLIPGREKARAAIMAGQVLVNGQKVSKPGTLVAAEAELQLLESGPTYASRGGWKLEKALQSFNLDLNGLTVLDVGASTGGFTDCALRHGANKVYAVDVGYGQLAWTLRQDARVVCLERTNIRYLTPDRLGILADLATIDVSFISLSKVLPAVTNLIKPGGAIVALIKPQFEAGRELVGKKGVVRDPETHRQVINNVLREAHSLGLACQALTFSPLRGPEGNIEYLAEFQKGPVVPDMLALVDGVVAEAHLSLPG